MSSSLRRGALAASVIAFSVASLAACGSGNNSQILQIKPDNAATGVGAIKIQNAIVITQPAGGASGPAVISATLFNSGSKAQTLDSVSVEGDGSAELTAAGGKGSVTVPAGGSLVLGGAGNASAALKSPGANVADGNAQKVTFTFSETGAVSLRAFVVPAESYFTKWGPSSIPTPSASASAAASPSGSPSGSASPAAGASSSPSGSASASASASGQ
ncbi:copper chaperone PCu(A)C [Streptomyces sp. NPDC047000]|uniref:copper chaperone PCu(A)C n=1 Tax=Streptomyces sp. NPDC047000 TaxID=3155474 RepID=UPI0033E5E329